MATRRAIATKCKPLKGDTPGYTNTKMATAFKWTVLIKTEDVAIAGCKAGGGHTTLAELAVVRPPATAAAPEKFPPQANMSGKGVEPLSCVYDTPVLTTILSRLG